MRVIWKIAMLAAVPMMALGQDADGGGDDGATPKADAGEALGPYATILERMPFGPLPPNFNPDAPPGTAAPGAGGAGEDAAEVSMDEQQIISSVRVSILNVTPSGVVAVGFTDSAAQPPAHYYMKVGEKRDVWEVKEADPAEQTVVLAKNGVEATLKLGEGVAGGDKKAKGAGPATRPAPKRAGAVAAAGGAHASAMERLRARRMRSVADLKAEDERREAAAAEERKNAAQAAAERAQQREALMQIQEELRRQREEREQRAAQEAQEKQQNEPVGE